uniref:Uncharacterized protein n=1 Tax=Panagrolaimus sp. JU765 TaxID=591449 RepID=A0AC34QRD0_9BILA
MKAVKSCPRDSYPSGTEKTKVQFTCLNRSDVETRRLLRESRDVDITDKLVGKKPSFAETVTVPRECSQN